MVCHLLGAKPWLEPMVTYYKLDHKEHNPIKSESNYENFQAQKLI